MVAGEEEHGIVDHSSRRRSYCWYMDSKWMVAMVVDAACEIRRMTNAYAEVDAKWDFYWWQLGSLARRKRFADEAGKDNWMIVDSFAAAAVVED